MILVVFVNLSIWGTFSVGSICVIRNAFILKAKLPEVKITVDASCCACVTPESHKIALSAMKLCQINVTGE